MNLGDTMRGIRTAIQDALEGTTATSPSSQAVDVVNELTKRGYAIATLPPRQGQLNISHAVYTVQPEGWAMTVTGHHTGYVKLDEVPCRMSPDAAREFAGALIAAAGHAS